MTTRRGGVSPPPWDSLNLGLASGDEPGRVEQNRARLAAAIGARPVYLRQVHGAGVVRVDAASLDGPPPDADAAWTDAPGIACAVLVADCLPVLLAAPLGRAVAAAHAGWRGLAAGVLENTVQALCSGAGCDIGALVAWLGPCIGPREFEVGADVLQAFGEPAAPADSPHFRYRPRADGQPRWRADLAGLARERLLAIGLRRISGGGWCTVEDRSRFFSFRRDGITGRMAAAAWIRAPAA
jgi:YfiH family protein